jgi:hypothetical protein
MIRRINARSSARDTSGRLDRIDECCCETFHAGAHRPPAATRRQRNRYHNDSPFNTESRYGQRAMRAIEAVGGRHRASQRAQ